MVRADQGKSDPQWSTEASEEDLAPAGLARSQPLPRRSLRVRLGDMLTGHAAPLDLGRPGVRVLLVLGLLAVVVGGFYAWRSRPSAEPLGPPLPMGASAEAPFTPGSRAGGASAAGAGPAGASSVAGAGPDEASSVAGVRAAGAGLPGAPPAGFPLAGSAPVASAITTPADRLGRPAPGSSGALVIVHVTGKVRKPGLVTLPAGARVADAVTAAGGVRAGAGIGGLNLARRLTDGEQIVVGAPAVSGPAAVPLSDPVSGPAPVLDLNAASPTELETLPGVGEVLARRIVEFRQLHAGFRSVDQLRQVSGIGDRKFAELRDKVRV